MLTRLIKGCSTLKSWAMRIASRAGVSNAKVARLRESVHGDILDSQNWLKRWFAENVVADADELPFHSGVRGTGQESLVVWYSTTRKGKRRFLLALFPKSESESRQAPQSQNPQIAGAAGRARPAVFQTTLT
jgi:hypothetical protein